MASVWLCWHGVNEHSINTKGTGVEGRPCLWLLLGNPPPSSSSLCFQIRKKTRASSCASHDQQYLCPLPERRGFSLGRNPGREGCGVHDSGSLVSLMPRGPAGQGQAAGAMRGPSLSLQECMVPALLELWEDGDTGPRRHRNHHRQIPTAGSEPQSEETGTGRMLVGWEMVQQGSPKDGMMSKLERGAGAWIYSFVYSFISSTNICTTY